MYLCMYVCLFVAFPLSPSADNCSLAPALVKILICLLVYEYSSLPTTLLTAPCLSYVQGESSYETSPSPPTPYIDALSVLNIHKARSKG